MYIYLCLYLCEPVHARNQLLYTCIYMCKARGPLRHSPKGYGVDLPDCIRHCSSIHPLCSLNFVGYHPTIRQYLIRFACYLLDLHCLLENVVSWPTKVWDLALGWRCEFLSYWQDKCIVYHPIKLFNRTIPMKYLDWIDYKLRLTYGKSSNESICIAHWNYTDKPQQLLA